MKRRMRVLNFALITVCMFLMLTLIPLSNPLSQNISLDEQALMQAKRFFSRMSIKCGEYYYYAYREQRAIMFQCKYPPTVSVDGRTYQPQRLSEADRLNGVDPLPIAWQGRAVIQLGLCRRQVPGPNGAGYDAWEPWADRNADAVPLTNKKGKWEFFNQPTGREAYTVKTVLPITCNDVPNRTRKVMAKPPYWSGQYQGSPVLRLPANYDRWFYVGRGPMTLKLTHMYSEIEIDGANNSRSPLGEATYMGAKKTDPKSLAPDALLGAVIVKIGRDSDPVQPFTESTDPANGGFQIRSDDEVFIAINDSYFADNRGEHVVVVDGEHLNLDGQDKLPAPKPLTPSDGASFNYAPQITVEWAPVTDASSYTVEIQFLSASSWYDLAEHYSNYPAAGYVPPIKIRATSFSFGFVGANDGRWRVWAIDSKGNEGIKSEWQQFHYRK